MKPDIDTIKKIAEEFTSRTFGTEIPHNLCFSTCFPLSILLDSKQLKNSLTCGDYGAIRHFWLTLDSEGTILDPTIRQFNKKIGPVYIGKLTENTTTEKFIPIKASINEWFKPQYSIWAEPLIDKQPRTCNDRPEGFEERMNLMNIRTATVLNNYIETMPLKSEIIKTNKYKYYFSPIFKFLKDKSNADENFINSMQILMPKNFNLLVSNALDNN